MFGYNNQYLTKDGKPWFPIMGEVHYSRLPENEWRETLYKMKAGGVTVVSAYTIWIHHEEIRGEWDFSGQRNLREFIKAVKNCGLYLFLRIGPWVHAEVRNGGFPDWMLCGDFTPRTNDERYFHEVKRFYEKIHKQARGFFYSDGGPVIGVQIENEYGHCGGLTGEDGEEHMRRLTKIAKEIGFDAPLYTATGWGGAVTGGLLPVMGGYCDAPWDTRITEIEPSGNYIFTHERNDHNIGSDLGIGAGLTFDTAKFPYLTAELGGGLQVTKHRRPVARARDISAMSVVKLGSGVNLLGYYMYCGGVNPDGKKSTLQESRDTGYLNDLPVKNYDFRAPVGAYGQLGGSFKELKLLGMFAADFGEALCEMPAFIPDDNPLDPCDGKHLRYSLRHNGKWGFLFFNNYLRRMKRPDFKKVRLAVKDLNLTLPPIDINAGEFGFYPFNMPVSGGVVRFAEASPLCEINGTTVLYGKSMDAVGDVMLISRDDALNAYKIKLETEHLVICESPVLPDDNGYYIRLSGNTAKLKVYPKLPRVPDGFLETGADGKFSVYTKTIAADKAVCDVERCSETGYRITFSQLDPNASDYLLHVRYNAESTDVLIGEKLVYDDFWADGGMCMGLMRHGFPDNLEVELTPLFADDKIFLEEWPRMENSKACSLEAVSLERIINIRLNL